MAIVLSTRRDITLDVFERVAWQGESVSIPAATLERVDRARTAFLRLLDRPGAVVYGVTSGYGDRAGVALSREERRQQARAAGLRAGSFGEALPERVARGIVLARLANLLDGHAAVSSGLVTAVAALLDSGPLAPVPLRGNGGSGEILALANLFGPLIQAHDLGDKEGLALINGSPCAAALVADALLAARGRLRVVYDVLALSVEAFRAPLDAYDQALGELWGDEHEARALGELAERLNPESRRRTHQGPVSFRILPRVLGQAERSLHLAEQAAAASLRSVTDNPVYLLPSAEHPDGRVLSTGGYHNAAAPAALHQLAVTWADLCQVAERHIEKLAFLDDRGSDVAELARLLPMIAVGHSEDARSAAQPVILPRGGPGQNDVASPAFLAWEREQRAAEALESALAVLATAASLRLQTGTLTPRLTTTATASNSVAKALLEQRPFGHALGQLADQLRAAIRHAG